MSLKDTLTAQLGDRMRASMGAGDAPEPDATPAVPPGTTGQAPAKHRRPQGVPGRGADPHRTDHGRPGSAPEDIPRRGDRPHGRQPANPRHAPADPRPVGRGPRPLGHRRRRAPVPGRPPGRLDRGPVCDRRRPADRGPRSWLTRSSRTACARTCRPSSKPGPSRR